MAQRQEEDRIFDGPSLILPDRQLRVTKRCLKQDLGGDGKLKDLVNHPIVKAFIRERTKKFAGGRQISPLTSGKSVHVIAHQHEHRGGTWHDVDHEVVWLVAYGRHKSGVDGDFFPFAKALDEKDLLLPTEEDYRELLLARDRVFAARLMIQAPMLLKEARTTGREVTRLLGGKFGTAVAVEVVDEYEAVTVAFDVNTIESEEFIVAVLGALVPDAEWDPANRMPSRDLRPDEIAYEHLGLTPQ